MRLIINQGKKMSFVIFMVLKAKKHESLESNFNWNEGTSIRKMMNQVANNADPGQKTNS